MGDNHIYVMGGKDSRKLTFLGKVMKFNVNKLKWEEMPDLNYPRVEAGSFMCRKKENMYIFGGSHDSVERINLHDPSAKWEKMEVEIPIEIAFKGGLTMLPMWYYNHELESVSKNSVLVFGGGMKDVYSYNPKTNTVNPVFQEQNEENEREDKL